MHSTLIVPVILSGGSGTRLWPVSRESFPKQLWPLISDRTLLQETALRAHDGARFAPPIVVCNQEHRFLIAEQLRAAGHCFAAYPAGADWPQQRAGDRCRGDAGRRKTDPDAVLWLLAADHAIADTVALHAALAIARPPRHARAIS